MQLQLHDAWFVLIAVLWTGYFFLEGFDFGIGILTRVVARNDEERGVLLATIGPVWDGNEVWLLTAVGATFAAFPDWYATMCSGFYLPMLAVVVCLIVRGVALEYRAKREDAAWKRTCDRCIFWSSLVCAPLWGFVFANMVHGVPIGPDRDFTGSLLDLVNPYSLLGSAVTLCLFTFHGALYAALKTSGELRKRSRETARRASGFTVVFVLAFLMWTQKNSGGTSTQVLLAVVAATLILAAELNDTGRDGWAFALSGLTVAAITATLFLALFPAVMPSSLSPTLDLTVANSSASPHTLRILTWVAAFMVPVVIGYQSWTYWIFRKRVDPRRAPAPCGTTKPTEGEPGMTMTSDVVVRAGANRFGR